MEKPEVGITVPGETGSFGVGVKVGVDVGEGVNVKVGINVNVIVGSTVVVGSNVATFPPHAVNKVNANKSNNLNTLKLDLEWNDFLGI